MKATIIITTAQSQKVLYKVKSFNEGIALATEYCNKEGKSGIDTLRMLYAGGDTTFTRENKFDFDNFKLIEFGKWK